MSAKFYEFCMQRAVHLCYEIEDKTGYHVKFYEVNELENRIYFECENLLTNNNDDEINAKVNEVCDEIIEEYAAAAEVEKKKKAQVDDAGACIETKQETVVEA